MIHNSFTVQDLFTVQDISRIQELSFTGQVLNDINSTSLQEWYLAEKFLNFAQHSALSV